MSTDHLIPAVFYGRKSDDDDGASVEQQVAWARKAAPEAGIEIVKEFADHAKAGWRTAARTDFHEMLAFCQKRAKAGTPIEAVLCWKPNRFSRADSIETSWFIHEFRKAGVCRMFTAARGWVDFSRMEDRIIFGIEQDASCHRYVIDLAQDSTRGRLAGAREGRWMGGPVPHGYRPEMQKVTKKGRTRWVAARLVLGPEAEAKIVRHLFLDYANTPAGLRCLAQRLNAAGVPAPRGGKWGLNTVKRILRNPAYLGRLVWGRQAEGKFFGVVNAEIVPLSGPQRNRPNQPSGWIYAPAQTHEPLVDLPTWEKCQAKLARRKKERQPRLGCYALSGLVRCGHCGEKMVARVDIKRRANGRVHKYRRVLCGTYLHGGSAACQCNAVDADQLARAVIGKLQAHLFSPAALEALRQEVRRQAEAGAAGGKALVAIEARLAQLAKGIERAARRVVEEEDDRLVPALRKQLKAVTDEHDELARQVDAARLSQQKPEDLDALVEEAMAQAGRLEEALASEDGDLLRDVLGEAVSYVELFFEHEPWGKKGRTRSRFARGLIYLRPQRWNECTQVNGRSAPSTKTSALVLAGKSR
jgi:DNA invertase Pin-like site-specific DNA recombinase